MPDALPTMDELVTDGARWLQGRAGLGPLEEHPAVVYTGEGYRVWLESTVRSILEGVGVPDLLARLRAAEAALGSIGDAELGNVAALLTSQSLPMDMQPMRERLVRNVRLLRERKAKWREIDWRGGRSRAWGD